MGWLSSIAWHSGVGYCCVFFSHASAAEWRAYAHGVGGPNERGGGWGGGRSGQANKWASTGRGGLRSAGYQRLHTPPLLSTPPLLKLNFCILSSKLQKCLSFIRPLFNFTYSFFILSYQYIRGTTVFSNFSLGYIINQFLSFFNFFLGDIVFSKYINQQVLHSKLKSIFKYHTHWNAFS